jgi:hypothetical protein
VAAVVAVTPVRLNVVPSRPATMPLPPVALPAVRTAPRFNDAADAIPVTVDPVKSTVLPDGKSVVTPDRPMANDVALVPPIANAPLASIDAGR